MYSPVEECCCGCPEFSVAGSYANVQCRAQSLVIRVPKETLFFSSFFPFRVGWLASIWTATSLSPCCWSLLCKDLGDFLKSQRFQCYFLFFLLRSLTSQMSKLLLFFPPAALYLPILLLPLLPAFSLFPPFL